jgi:hypothetical protein
LIGVSPGRGLTGLKGTVAGVGVTAFPRTGVSGLIPGYRIVCARRTADLQAIARSTEVFCLEEAEGIPLPAVKDSATLLSHPATRSYLARLPQPVHLLLYQSTLEIERLARENAWNLLANPAALRMRTGDRAFFQRTAAGLALPPIPGAMVSLRRFREKPFESWARDLGGKIVVQLPDVPRGGGRSTFFLEGARELDSLKGYIQGGHWQGCRLRRVSVRMFVEGEPCSISVCIMGGKLFLSPLQRQIIDPPWVSGVLSRGVFAGHSWGGEAWGGGVEAEARRQATAFARVLAVMGYRGVFGLDFLVDRSGGRVTPVELNPRLTGAFPVLSRLQAGTGRVPLELMHVASFLRPFEPAKPPLTASACSGRLKGAHIVLFKGGGSLRRRQPAAGLYSEEGAPHRIRWVGEASGPGDVEAGDRFVLVDNPCKGPEKHSTISDPLERIGRLLFPGPVLTPEGLLRPRVVDVAEGMQSLMLER